MEVKSVYDECPVWVAGCHQPLSEKELLDCRGGMLPAAAWWAIASLIISNWQDVREGFSDGVSGKPARYHS